MNVTLEHIIPDLSPVYSSAEARELALWIIEESTGLSRTQILTDCKDTKNIPNYKVILQRILKKEPIQYIFEHTEWSGLDLRVTPATLIPRPETAELVTYISRHFTLCFLGTFPEGRPKVTRRSPEGRPEVSRQSFDSRSTVIRQSKPLARVRVLDIGTGSGCIAIALKKQHPAWQISAMDISGKALAVANENAKRNQVEINFFQGDIFTDEIGDFDIIVSNPPYVLEGEKATMENNVLDYEPHTALFVPDSDPLRYYRRIASLKKAPFLFFEINRQMGAALCTLLQDLDYTDIHLQKDSYGNDRILSARIDC
ncbi:MAG: peptide chain release factor N(5)-glutamine methyltransferase [Paludibacteraceae bacterium]|nr:peptide chain release factor N(5)-glutamine methyltransferase [Paludibacteraceae bacterium]